MARQPNTNRVRELRELAGLTQDELAERLGTTYQQISKHERGERRLTISWLNRYAAALNVSPADLIAAPQVDEVVNEAEPASIEGWPSVSSAIASRGLGVYRVLASRVTDAGISNGQIITVDQSEGARQNAKAGDVILARYSGTDLYIIRQFIPPFTLITNMRGNRNSVLRLDDRSIVVEIVGVLIRE